MHDSFSGQWLVLKRFQNQTQDVVIRHHLLDFFPLAPLARFFFSAIFPVQQFSKLPNPPLTRRQKIMPHRKLVYCQSYKTLNTLPCLLRYHQSQMGPLKTERE